MNARIGLFGGTFDPVHNAHVALADTAIAALRLEELRWIPAGQPWQKARRITPARHREAMVRLAIEGRERHILDRSELQRPGASYAIDTVRELQAARPGASWFLIIGGDQYAGLQSWQGWRELLERVTLAVAARPGVPASPHAEVLACAHQVVPLPPMAISSTEVRERAARGEPIGHLVPPAVASYIDQQALYRAASRS